VIVVGLPGSGKSRWIDERRAEFTGLVDSDYFEDSLVPTLRFTDSRHYRPLIAAQDCLVADIAFCDTLRRVKATQALAFDVPTAEVKWVFFENNPEACYANIIRDGRARALGRLKQLNLAHKYIVPPDVETLPVWKPIEK
jgi:hypothetical protein